MNFGTDIVGRKSISVFHVGDGNPAVLVAAVASKKVRVLGYSLVGNSPGNVIDLTDGAGTNLGRVSSGSSPTVCPIHAAGWFETATGQSLRMTAAAGAVIVGHLAYEVLDA